MGIYAKRPGILLGQLAADLFMIAWTIGWWFAGRAADSTVRAVADPARRAGSAARQLSEQVGRAAEQAGRVPAVGADLRSPLDDAVRSLGQLITSADAQVSSIEAAAVLLGWLVFAIPVLVLLVIWLPRRIRFFLRARAAQRFIDAQSDLDLFALRAMVAQPMHVIAKISDDPVSAWRRGDREVIQALAAIELRRSGLRPPLPTSTPLP